MYIGVYLCEGFRCPGSRVTDSCELPFGFWESNLSCLEEQLVLLTIKPFLQPQGKYFRLDMVDCTYNANTPEDYHTARLV